MNGTLGWALAVLAIAVGYMGYGWRGVVLGVTVIAFWLLLQFSRALRVMRKAGAAPIESVRSAVMLGSRLHAGMKMMEVIQRTDSLGRRVGETPEVWRWTDPGGDRILLTFERGVLARWQVERAARDDDAPATAEPPRTA